jgi:hypothetical protein
MAKTKISEFSSTPGNNTDIDSINIAEGCAPSGINNAIRELMAQLKDFQAGTAGDSFNGPVGTTTAAAGAFTTLTASSTATLNTLASSGATLTGGTINNMALGGTTAAAVSATTLTTSSTVTHNGGTANGVAYLNGSKVLTTGSALTFDGTNLGVGITPTTSLDVAGPVRSRVIGGVAQLYLNNGATQLSIDNNSGNMVFTLAAAAEQMRLTSTGLGIGTSSPATKLHVFGSGANSRLENSGATTSTQFTVKNTVGTVTLGLDSSTGGGFGVANAAVLWYDAAQPLVFGTSNTERMRLDSSGNLGLGVTPSAWASGFKAFQVAANTAVWGGTGTTGPSYFSNNVIFDGARKYINTAAASEYQQNSGSHLWLTAPSGTAGNAISFTQAMTLDASGNLAIGHTSPSTRLDVVGSSQIRHQFTGAATGFSIGQYNSSGDASINNGANAPLLFATNNTERARIDSSGNLLIQSTSSSVTSGVGHKIRPDAAAPFMGTVGSSTSGADVTYSLYSTGAAAYRFYVGYNGTISATTTTISGISDQRLKENIQDLDAGLDKIMELKPRKFDWKAGKGKDIKGDRGFIAQEFEQVFPDLIDTWKDPAPEGEDPYKSVRADLIPVLVKAIQEQQAIIESLKARLDAANL